jgi:hypothetical protein
MQEFLRSRNRADAWSAACLFQGTRVRHFGDFDGFWLTDSVIDGKHGQETGQEPEKGLEYAAKHRQLPERTA